MLYLSTNFRLLPFRWERTFSMLLKLRMTSLFIGRKRFECSNKFKYPKKRSCLCMEGVEVSNWWVLLPVSYTHLRAHETDSYLVIWRSRKKRISTVRSFRQNQEARFSRTIFLVTAASFITWMPFLYYIIAERVWPDLTPWSASFFIKLLQYSNSFVNFVIYILRFPSYRKALFSLCRLHCVL